MRTEKPETPPRARGRHAPDQPTRQLLRNTPACAGKTRFSAWKRHKLKKHPRVRGEDESGTYHTGTHGETPPRARGRLEAQPFLKNRLGNTPACAGKTHVSENQERHRWKHPRVRGEDLNGGGATFNLPETPPRARGRLVCIESYLAGFRNTPACAGKTEPRTGCKLEPWKHPRVRGEDASAAQARVGELETPPRARGRRSQELLQRADGRNTPACAGKTF